MKKFLDPDFAYHLALGKMWAWMGLSLAESDILPFKVQDETVALRQVIQQLEEKYHSVLEEHSISLGTFSSRNIQRERETERQSKGNLCIMFF